MTRALLFALVLLLGTATGAAAQSVKPLEQILKELPAEYSGRVLDTRLKGKTYEIRVLLSSGEVVELVVDGVTGEVKQAKAPDG